MKPGKRLLIWAIVGAIVALVLNVPVEWEFNHGYATINKAVDGAAGGLLRGALAGILIGVINDWLGHWAVRKTVRGRVQEILNGRAVGALSGVAIGTIFGAAAGTMVYIAGILFLLARLPVNGEATSVDLTQAGLWPFAPFAGLLIGAIAGAIRGMSNRFPGAGAALPRSLRTLLP